MNSIFPGFEMEKMGRPDTANYTEDTENAETDVRSSLRFQFLPSSRYRSAKFLNYFEKNGLPKLTFRATVST